LKASQIISKQEGPKKPVRSVGLILCFLISAFFWLTLKLSQMKNHVVRIPVEYVLPPDFTSTDDLPNTIPFTIHARTGNLMTLNYRMQKNPLQIPLSKTSYTSEQLAELLNNRIYAKVESITTSFELAKINLDSFIEKTVPLAVNNNLTAKQGYTITEQKISPTAIQVKGASKLLAEIDSLYLSKLVLKNLDKDFSDSLHIIKTYSELIELSQEKAKLQIKVDQLVEKQLSYYSATLRDTLSIKVSSPSRLYHEIDSSYFQISLQDSVVRIVTKDNIIKILEFSPAIISSSTAQSALILSQ